MKINDKVRVISVGNPTRDMQGVVRYLGAMLPTALQVAVYFKSTPNWYRRRLALRGIFISPESEWNLSLFWTHTQDWMDWQTGDRFSIEEANGKSVQ